MGWVFKRAEDGCKVLGGLLNRKGVFAPFFVDLYLLVSIFFRKSIGVRTGISEEEKSPAFLVII